MGTELSKFYNIEHIFWKSCYDNTTCTLSIPSDFDSYLSHLPEGVKIIIFHHYSHFDEPVNDLPSTITHLTFGYIFDQPVDNLPNGLVYLKLGDNFNKPIKKLPVSLKQLELGHYFNHPVNELPSGLTHLTFGFCFNQMIPKLPKSLTHLTLGTNFNVRINKLPHGLTHLIFVKNSKFKKDLNDLPDSLLYLELGEAHTKLEHNLPINLKEVIIRNSELQLKVPFGCKITHK